MKSILVKGADRIELTIRSIATSRRMINGRIKTSRARARQRL